MAKTFIGPQLRQLRRERKQTQAEMAKVLGISPGYVNLLENNQRSLSVRLLMALADSYGVDWRDIVSDESVRELCELIPHAEVVDVAGAGHMVAGDKNDAFNSAVIEFVNR